MFYGETAQPSRPARSRDRVVAVFDDLVRRQVVTKTRNLDLRAPLKAAFDKALEAQYGAARANVARLRRVHPDKSPEELYSYLTKFYLGAVAATGAGAGAAAAVPNGEVQVPVAVVELLGFLEASVLFAMSAAEIHGLNVEDVERRKLLVMSVLAGDAAANATLNPLFERTAPYWAQLIVKKIPLSVINKANKVLGPRFILKWSSRQAVVTLGIQVPFLIGAGIGAGGNALFGWFIVKSAQKILGPAPQSWDELSESALAPTQVALTPA